MEPRFPKGITIRILAYLMLVALVPVLLLAGYLGWQQIDSAPVEATSSLANNWWLPLVCLAAATVTAFLLWQDLIRHVAMPLNDLIHVAEQLHAGNAQADFAIHGPAPIMRLAQTLQGIAQRLVLQQEELAVSTTVAQVMTSSAQPNDLLGSLAEHLADLVQATGCWILLQQGHEQPQVAARHGDYYAPHDIASLLHSEPSAIQIAMSGQRPLIIRDTNESPFVPAETGYADRSVMVLPLIVKEQTIGAAVLGDNRSPRDFSETDAERAMSIARQVAMAIENARLYDSAQRHLHDLSLLYQTSAAISATLDEQVVFDMATQAFAKVFDVDQCQLIVFDNQIWGQIVAEYSDQPGPGLRGLRLPVAGNALLEWVQENKRTLSILNVHSDPMLVGIVDSMALQEVKSLLALPLVSKGDAIGAIILHALSQPRAFNSEEISLAQTLANQIASVVQNARLYQQMSEEKRKFELAALSMGEGLIILDRDANLMFVNPQANTLLGINQTVLNLPLATVCPQPEMRDLLERREDTTDDIVIGEMQTTNGIRVRDLTLSLSPVRDEHNELQWWVMVIHDITRLKELDRLKSEFISTVSHELRTPLASIIGFAEMLLTQQPGQLTEIQDEFMNIIYTSAEHLLTLVNDLLDVSRMESGRFRLEKKPIQPYPIVHQVFSATKPAADQKKLQFALNADKNLPPVLADEQRLEQVLNNLVSNAIKFTDQGGKVSVTISQTDRHMRFAISDTGIGIPEEDMPKLFSKFYRSSQAVQKAIGGTGLGLYIARNIVESHGGQIEAKSKLGEGTTIWFSLPLHEPPGSPGKDII